MTREKPPPNKYLTGAVLGSLGLQVATQLVPGLRNLLGLAPLAASDVSGCRGCLRAAALHQRSYETGGCEEQMKRDFIHTSESVTEGHPDKLCDQISDAIIDRFLEHDTDARITAECAVAQSIVFIAARFASGIKVDFPNVARKVIRRIGYVDDEFSFKTCSILTSLKEMGAEYPRLDEGATSNGDISRLALCTTR